MSSATHFCFAGTLAISFVGAACAADLPMSEPVPELAQYAIFGEVYAGIYAASLKPSSDSDTYVAPYGQLGGKIAFQPAASAFGLQLDLAYAGMDASWISPAVHVDAAAHDGRGNVHISYLASERIKLGWYGGLEYDYIRGKYEGDSEHYDGLTWRTGVDGLFTYTPNTTFFAHMGYVDPFRASASYSGGSLVSGSVTDSSNIVWGLEAGVGVEHRLDDRWKAGLDADITQIRARDFGHADIIDLTAKIAYTPESIPGMITASAGWLPLELDVDHEDSINRNAFNVGLKYTYSFGAPATSAATTLLRN